MANLKSILDQDGENDVVEIITLKDMEWEIEQLSDDKSDGEVSGEGRE